MIVSLPPVSPTDSEIIRDPRDLQAERFRARVGREPILLQKSVADFFG
jgi:hypothetical protein